MYESSISLASTVVLDEAAVSAPNGAKNGAGSGSKPVKIVVPYSIEQHVKAKNTFKKQHLQLAGGMGIVAVLITCFMYYTHREVALAGICLTALAGMCLVMALAIMFAFGVLLKRVKRTEHRP